MSSPPIFSRTKEPGNQQQTELIDVTSNEYNIQNGNTLTVTNVGADDEGLYSCQSDGSAQQPQDLSPCVIIDGEFILVYAVHTSSVWSTAVKITSSNYQWPIIHLIEGCMVL